MNCGDVVEGKVIEICQDMAVMGGEDWKEGEKYTSTELTFPTLGNGNSFFKLPLLGDMLC